MPALQEHADEQKRHAGSSPAERRVGRRTARTDFLKGKRNEQRITTASYQGQQQEKSLGGTGMRPRREDVYKRQSPRFKRTAAISFGTHSSRPTLKFSGTPAALSPEAPLERRVYASGGEK